MFEVWLLLFKKVVTIVNVAILDDTYFGGFILCYFVGVLSALLDEETMVPS